MSSSITVCFCTSRRNLPSEANKAIREA
ncbi:hypothetical protein PS2_032278 [Malus domestica]